MLCVYYTVIFPPTDMTAVQNGFTSVLVSWSPSSNASGYKIYYKSSEGHKGSETVSSGSTNNLTLTGFHNGDNYTIISIVATSNYIDSINVLMDIILGIVLFLYHNIVCSHCHQHESLRSIGKYIIIYNTLVPPPPHHPK